MSNTVSDMQLFLLGLHDKNSFSCKNLEQLSSLWAAFTKCKQNIRDGFRLENMSWRLWYREAIVKKRLNTTTSITLPTSSTTLLDTTTTFNSNNYIIQQQQQPIKKSLSTQLVRTQSLPSLSHQNNMLSKYKKIDSLPVTRRSSATSSEALLPLPSSSTASSIKQSKFYIDYNEDEEDEDEDIFDYDDDTHSLSSNDSSIASYNDHPPLIQSKQPPISLLSHLLRKESSSQQSITNDSNNTNGLRRCQGYGKLDKWFLSAAAVSS